MRRTHRCDRDEAFTLVELLVVVVIIGILAAIAIPTFLNQRDRAYEAHAVSSLGLAAVAQQTYFTADRGSYADALEDLLGEGFVMSPLVEAATNGDVDAYCILAQHRDGGSAFLLRSSGPQRGQIVEIDRIAGDVTTCDLG